MSTNREKTSSMMGFVVSILLHGIFLAGCIAIDYGTLSSSTAQEDTEIHEMQEGEAEKSKS
jgi:hypothetical protein